MRTTRAVVFDVDHLARGPLNALLTSLRHRDLPCALVGHPEELDRLGSASRECHLVPLGVDANDDRDAAQHTAFFEARRALEVDTSDLALVTGTPSSAAIAIRDGFGLTVGITAESGQSRVDRAFDVVVADLGDLPDDANQWSALLPMPNSALDSVPEILVALGDSPAIFLDYDGTLTPIVDDPARAVIGDRERSVLHRLAGRVPVAIVSGRGLDDVRSLVALDELTYAGSHGFEIESPDGERYEHPEARPILPDLDEAEAVLRRQLAPLEGVAVERKRFAVAVHTRRAGSQHARERAGQLTRSVAEGFDRLVTTGGKEVIELRPAVSWDKGAALSYLLDVTPGDPTPLYVGDDATDEDGFAKVRELGNGVGILVGSVESPSQTWARYTLASPEDTVSFLTLIADHL